jgi:hypothetical protein
MLQIKHLTDFSRGKQICHAVKNAVAEKASIISGNALPE